MSGVLRAVGWAEAREELHERCGAEGEGDMAARERPRGVGGGPRAGRAAARQACRPRESPARLPPYPQPDYERRLYPALV